MKKLFLLLTSSVLLLGCATKEAPSPIGEPVSVEQIKNLPQDDSWNNKLVSFEGYFGFCRPSHLKAGSKTSLRLSTEANCKGDKIIDAKIRIQLSSSSVIFGSAPRNEIVAGSEFTTETLQVITDDYQKVGYQKFLFSGKLIYSGTSYSLDNVTIHVIK
jgi:hypothetical protein